jgi:hypothetical protein
MDIIKMLQDLRSEREQIEEAILTLERLARGQGRRRGRPPKWMLESAGSTRSRKSRTKRVLSPEARARIAAGQRKHEAALVSAGGHSLGWLIVEEPDETTGDISLLRLEFAADAKGTVEAVLVLGKGNDRREVANARPASN